MSTPKPVVRGIDHIGITVPDIETATEFFATALDASVLYDPLPKQPEGADDRFAKVDLSTRLGVHPTARIRGIRMLRLGESATLELFEYSVEDQTSPIRPDGLGFQHIGIYVDDIDAIGERVEAAGGELMTGPNLMKGPEEGAGNATWYMRTPWGSTIELVSFPSPKPIEADHEVKRWHPPACHGH